MIYALAFLLAQTEAAKPDLTANYVVLGLLILIVVVLAIVVINKRKKSE